MATKLPEMDGPESIKREKWFYLDIRNRGAWKGKWREGAAVVARVDIPVDRASAQAKITDTWQNVGSHRGDRHDDAKSDHAVILIGPETTKADVTEAFVVLQAPRRESRTDAGTELSSAFEISVADADDPALKQKTWERPSKGNYVGPAPKIRFDPPTVSGRLPPSAVASVLKGNRERIIQCYENGLMRSPALEGTVRTRFVIDNEGVVRNVSNGGSDLPDSMTVRCILDSHNALAFAEPEGGIVTVVEAVFLSTAH